MENRPAPLRSRRVCRFCLTEAEPLTYIYDREQSRPFQVPLSLQIMSCVAIEVYSADGMPQMICQNCRWNLDRCYKFKQQCKKADEALRAYPVSGVLPRPFPPITIEQPEPTTKRNLDTRPVNEPIKKPRLDNGENERRNAAHAGQREQREQREQQVRSEKQQRDKERELYDEDQDAGSEGDHESNDNKNDSSLEPGEIRVHACTQCERTFPLLQSLQLHIQRAHRDRDYKCTECDRMFFSKYDLQKHMTTHSEEKPYSCQICQKQFSRANLLQRHEKTHREELRYGCPQCDREFFSPEELEKHEEAVHKTVKPFQCNICGKRFTYKQGLERHEMLHNEDKSFVCEYCKEAFRTSTKLARHLSTHAGHRPFLCKLCPRSFLLSHHLTRHMRSHSVEKRHQCEDCGKAFKRKESLDVHQLTHVKRPGMGLTCDVCNESCRNRADYVTHIKQHIEAGEKMGPDGIPPENKDKLGDITESEEEEDEEEEDQYSDDDYEPPQSYFMSAKKRQSIPRRDSEEEDLEREDKKEQVVYVRNKDGNVVRKTIKTLMPVTRQQEAKATTAQISNAKQLKEETTQKIGRVDETEAQVQKIVASVFKEHKIPLKEQGKESPHTATRQSPQVAPSIIKEEKIEPSVNIPPQKNVKVIKRVIVRKPAGSVDAQSVSTPLKEIVREVTTSQQQSQPTPSTSGGPKVTKRVIVRRIIRQGDTTREVIMNPDGTLIDPAELAKLPTGNVVKRVVVKKPLDKGQNIEAMLQAADAKSLLQMAESGEEIIKASSMSKPATQVRRVEIVSPAPDRETQQKLELLEKRVEQQRLKIEELQARKQQEYEPCDEMLPERHDESEDEQQLPLKRVFVKRKQSIYDEVRDYNDESCGKEKDEEQKQSSTIVVTASSLEAMDQIERAEDHTNSIENAKIIIIKPEENQPDVDEMSRELCNILESTETVVKMHENVLNNLTQITSTNEQAERHTVEETVAEETNNGNMEVQVTDATEQHMETEEVGEEQVHEQDVEEMNEQENATVKIEAEPDQDSTKLNFEHEHNQEVDEDEIDVERTESGLSALSTQVLTETNDMFEASDSTMEVEKSSHEQQNLDESVIELSTTNETININETADQSSRDSLEDKLSQMEG
ncbi:uncharacterized protein LOC131664473 [Phymastichus coffea]|uniref:uncharacterized protein LOC131664473 n=1 Tax=Phymastichus coffea TaxID=108790 RepID=UPI00273AEF31|nr:uncharacterized protein LOC131664473 [Phymastichus coffea]